MKVNSSLERDEYLGICSGTFPLKNPFCTSNFSDIQSKIYALGLRNPMRFVVVPSEIGPGISEHRRISFLGTIYIGDANNDGYEEVNQVSSPGMNFGWP